MARQQREDKRELEPMNDSKYTPEELKASGFNEAQAGFILKLVKSDKAGDLETAEIRRDIKELDVKLETNFKSLETKVESDIKNLELKQDSNFQVLKMENEAMMAKMTIRLGSIMTVGIVVLGVFMSVMTLAH